MNKSNVENSICLFMKAIDHLASYVAICISKSNSYFKDMEVVW